METVSDPDCGNSPEEFERFRGLLRELFPNIFKACEIKDFDGALLLKWAGTGSMKMPVLFMNHYDVVPLMTRTVDQAGNAVIDTESGFHYT